MPGSAGCWRVFYVHFGLCVRLRNFATRQFSIHSILLTFIFQVDPVARETTVHFFDYLDTKAAHLANVTPHALHLLSRLDKPHLEAALWMGFVL